MYIPTIPEDPMIDDKRMLTEAWRNFFDVLRQNMQQALSNEGFLIPSVNNTDMLKIQNGVDANGDQIALPGTMVFNTTSDALYVLLNGGDFHPITTT